MALRGRQQRVGQRQDGGVRDRHGVLCDRAKRAPRCRSASRAMARGHGGGRPGGDGLARNGRRAQAVPSGWLAPEWKAHSIARHGSHRSPGSWRTGRMLAQGRETQPGRAAFTGLAAGCLTSPSRRWSPQSDSNGHARRRQGLKLVRLPIAPWREARGMNGVHERNRTVVGGITTRSSAIELRAPRKKRDTRNDGGADRIQTGVCGFAIRCMVALLPHLKKWPHVHDSNVQPPAS